MKYLTCLETMILRMTAVASALWGMTEVEMHRYSKYRRLIKGKEKENEHCCPPQRHYASLNAYSDIDRYAKLPPWGLTGQANTVSSGAGLMAAWPWPE